MRVLFTNAGRRTYLLQFALDLVRDGMDLEIHVSDCTRLAAAMHVAPEIRTHVTPPASAGEEAYVSALLDLVRREGIDVVMPLSDLDPPLLAGHGEAFARAGVTLLVSAAETVARCNDKRRTFEFCRQSGLPTPDSWFEAGEYPGPYPAIRKHILGSGSSGLERVEGPAGLAGFVAGTDMVQPLIEGEEFGIDILNDLQGRFVAACVKRKLLMRAGETDKAEVVDDPELEALARRISQAFRHVGNLDCDVLRRASDGALFCIDFNPRFGGGYPATHLAGFNFLRAILDMVAGRSVSLPSRPRPIVVMKGISLHWCPSP